jgi:hypothetical protein
MSTVTADALTALEGAKVCLAKCRIDVGTSLRTRRQTLGYSGRQMADLIDADCSMYSKLERGKIWCMALVRRADQVMTLIEALPAQAVETTHV